MSGAGVFILGNSKPELVQRGFFIEAGHSGSTNRLFVSVSFRSSTESCGTTKSNLTLGDRLVVNGGPGGIAYELPVTKADAEKNGWVAGSCFSAMGRHWFKDLESNEMTWCVRPN